MAALCESALRLLEADLTKERIAVRLAVPNVMPSISVDATQIEQVLVNLIRNAMEAMRDVPEGHRALTIAAARDRRGDDHDCRYGARHRSSNRGAPFSALPNNETRGIGTGLGH